MDVLNLKEHKKNNWLKILVPSNLLGCLGIGATIRTRQESQCLPYAGFLNDIIGMEVTAFLGRGSQIGGFCLMV